LASLSPTSLYRTDANPKHSAGAAEIAVFIACSAFLLLGLTLIPYTGIQTDEAIFANPLFGPTNRDFRIILFHLDIPLMVMSYMGTLKALLYWPILSVFGHGPYSIRVPVVVAGAVTILALFKFSKIAASIRAGLAAALLLASDPAFLLCTTFDWGPVALGHLLLVTGCLAVANSYLELGCLLFGLALWNKAIFLWPLTGLIAGLLVAYLPEFGITLTDWRRCARSLCMFLLGASPLILYNVHQPNATLRLNAQLSLEDVGVKFQQLELATRGATLFGYLATDDGSGSAKPLGSWHGRASWWIRERLGKHRFSLFGYAILLAILATPLWWRSPLRKAGVFSLTFSVVTFAAMAVTRHAGSAVHHILMLWPMPHLLVGVAIAALRPRWLFPPLVAVLVLSNLLVINQYLIQLERWGAAASFTDAIYPLSDALPDSAGYTIYVIDWGMWDNLELLHFGKLHMVWAGDHFTTANPDEASRREITKMLSDPHGLFLGHVPSREEFRGVGERLTSRGSALHYERQLLRTISDSNGRPVFEIFRFATKP
jgi:hypothetical protein